MSTGLESISSKGVSVAKENLIEECKIMKDIDTVDSQNLFFQGVNVKGWRA